MGKSSDISIIRDFLKAGFNITPDALNYIRNLDNPAKFTRLFLNSYNRSNGDHLITINILEQLHKVLVSTIRDISIDTPDNKKIVDDSRALVAKEKKPVKVDVKENSPKDKSNNALPPRKVEKTIIMARELKKTPESKPVISKASSSPVTEEVSDPISTIQKSPSKPRGPRMTSKSQFTPMAREHDEDLKILEDCTTNLKNEGEFKDFLQLFKDRFNSIKNIFKSRKDINQLIDIADLSKLSRKNQNYHVFGMVNDKKRTKAGNLMLEVEDSTGSINVIISAKTIDPDIIPHILNDEVLCFNGFYKDGIFIANEFSWPDITSNRPISFSTEDLAILLISDLHIGSDNHLEKLWNRFENWMNGVGSDRKQKELAGKVKYVSIAGDIIDGVGIYPTQEQHLVITDVHKQIEVAAELLQRLPDHLKFIIAPGSHEPVRRAMPQPAIPKSYCQPLIDIGATMVSNPALIETNGIKTLMYHGDSFIDLSMDIPEISNSTPERGMEKLLKSRHLAPSFGKRSEIAPDRKDWLVINTIPDIFHTGHVHCFGVKKYRNVWMVNSGCFQGQTDFMRSLGIVPTPGKPNIITLKDLSLTTLNIT
ncbi:MAG: metallophosphoesterase [Candidatus Hodarchaeota archaeon]